MLARISFVRYQYPLVGGLVITSVLIILYYGGLRSPLPHFSTGVSANAEHLDRISNATLGVCGIYAVLYDIWLML